MQHFDGSPPATVSITITGLCASVSPSNEDVLQACLSYDEIDFVGEADGRLVRRKGSIRAYSVDGGCLIVPAGVVPRVVSRLRQCRIAVDVVDHRIQSQTPIQFDESRLATAEFRFPGLAHAITQHAEGTIEVQAGTRQYALLGEVCRLYRSARIFITSATVEDARRIGLKLRKFVHLAVESVSGWDWNSACRVVSGTFGSLDRGDPSDWDIIIFADAAQATAKATHLLRPEYKQHRVYALTSPKLGRSAKQDLQFEILAGPVIYRDPFSQQPLQRPLQVAFMGHGSTGGPEMPSRRDQQRALWLDSQRNRTIADVAVALYAGDEQYLSQFELYPEQDRWSVLPAISEGVSILVASIEQGQQLAELLPGWRLVHARANGDLSVAASSIWGIPGNSIITAVAASSATLIHARILILAGGGTTPLIPACIETSTTPRLLIDVWDDGNAHLAADTQGRFKAYGTLGCQILGTRMDHWERALARRISGTHIPHKNTSRRRRRRSHR